MDVGGDKYEVKRGGRECTITLTHDISLQTFWCMVELNRTRSRSIFSLCRRDLKRMVEKSRHNERQKNTLNHSLKRYGC
jgi:hypothetical protein